jgi:hypothetical protein
MTSLVLATVGTVVTYRSGHWRAIGKGVEEFGADMSPADQQQRTNRVERGLAPLAGKERIRHVQRQRQQAGKQQQLASSDSRTTVAHMTSMSRRQVMMSTLSAATATATTSPASSRAVTTRATQLAGKAGHRH